MPLNLDILDVGQGDGMVVWLPNGKMMMVDYGSTQNKDLVTHDSFEYFRENTAFKDDGQVLEWLVLTHGDSDHYNMVEEFLAEFKVNVRNVLHGGLETEYRGLIGRLRNRANPDGRPTTIVTGANENFFLLAPTADLGAEVLVVAIGVQAVSGTTGHRKNTRSVVLRIAYQGVTLMLTGDATTDTELQILGYIFRGQVSRDVLKANVLKVAHHGSHRSSSCAPFIAAVNPEYAFISSDRRGSLNVDQKPTGHRLPQALTISLLRKYASRLQTNCAEHSYVMSYQKSDYVAYNQYPDIRGQTLSLPPNTSDVEWIQRSSTDGIFTTLVTIGLSDNPDDPESEDGGTQYRVTISDDGGIDIFSTEDFTMFNKLSQVKN